MLRIYGFYVSKEVGLDDVILYSVPTMLQQINVIKLNEFNNKLSMHAYKIQIEDNMTTQSILKNLFEKIL